MGLENKCNASGTRRPLSTGESVRKTVKCACGKTLKVRVAFDGYTYEATLPNHNKL